MNTTELGDLLEHCPETCGIPCGSFTQFSISVSFHLSNIPGFLDSNAKKILEATLTDFITEWVHATESDFTFVLDSVELTSQNLVTTQRHVRRLTGSTLEVSVLFDGFTIGLTGDEVSELIVSGIDSSAFETALQQSNDFFSVAKVSSTSEVDNEVGAEIEGEEKTGASTATVVVAVLVSVSVFTFVLGACVYHGTSGQWVPQMKLPRLSNANLENNSSPRLSIPGSPPAASLLSFDESRAGEATNGFVRLMLSLSRSNSRSTDPDDSESHPSSDDPCLAPIISPMSEQSEESAPAEHPLANIIPPMIVIENIDDDAEICAENSTRKNQQVPSKRGEASSDFRTSLRDYRNHPEQPNTVAGML